jgi:hypothetical protein
MFKTIRNLLAKTYGFTVVSAHPKSNGKHYTFTFSEAVAWAGCYDRSRGAYIYKQGMIVAYKGVSTKPTVFKSKLKALTFDKAIQRSA